MTRKIRFRAPTYVPPGGGGGSTDLLVAGPNAPSGISTAWPAYDGSVLPTDGGTVFVLNSFGSGVLHQQGRGLSLIADSGNPTGSGHALNIKFPSYSDPDCPLMFTPDDFGGQASCRWGIQFNLNGSGRNWKTLYLRQNSQWSSGFSELGRTPTTNVLATGIVVTSTPTSTTLNCASVSWTTNQWAGKYAKRGSGNIYRIVSNTANQLVVTPTFPYTPYDFSPFDIVDFSFGPANGGNAGTKWYFPRLFVDCFGSGTVHGQPYSFNLTNVECENSYIGGIINPNTPGSGGEFIDLHYRLQIHDWDGVGTDGQGAVGTRGNVDYGVDDVFGAFPTETNLGITKGSFHDIEHILVLGTPNNADTTFRCYVDGILKLQHDNIPAIPKYKMTTVTVGVIDYTVPLLITAARWGYVWYDATYGGGARVPDVEHNQTIRAWYIGGKN